MFVSSNKNHSIGWNNGSESTLKKSFFIELMAQNVLLLLSSSTHTQPYDFIDTLESTSSKNKLDVMIVINVENM